MYWHIGDTTMRLGSITPRISNGVNSLELMFEWDCRVGRVPPILAACLRRPRSTMVSTMSYWAHNYRFTGTHRPGNDEQDCARSIFAAGGMRVACDSGH